MTQQDRAAAVLQFGRRRGYRPLRGMPTHRVAGDTDVDAAIGPYRRLIVLGGDAELALVLTRLLRAERLDVEVAYVPRRRTRATRNYRLPTGFRAARRAARGAARRVPLIRDETGSAIVGRACWAAPGGQRWLHGEAVVDDTTLFDGDVTAVWIEPTAAMPGLRAAVAGRPWRRWVTGRAAQLGSTGATVLRDGVPAARPPRRSAFYRNIEGWLLVR
ncbi:peptidase M50 [Mycobacterium avium]|uniref:peptidase M50 n=1 Tax=Mycobacterium avium TaxID=1764 RepID=UPI001CDB2ADA|nr:peptidase M50 [Mycobacterium avium]MCA2338166.1 peptidase M50 [Mycobacterium avium]